MKKFKNNIALLIGSLSAFALCSQASIGRCMKADSSTAKTQIPKNESLPHMAFLVQSNPRILVLYNKDESIMTPLQIYQALADFFNCEVQSFPMAPVSNLFCNCRL